LKILRELLLVKTGEWEGQGIAATTYLAQKVNSAEAEEVCFILPLMVYMLSYLNAEQLLCISVVYLHYI
jgi:hypothetical protein